MKELEKFMALHFCEATTVPARGAALPVLPSPAAPSHRPLRPRLRLRGPGVSPPPFRAGAGSAERGGAVAVPRFRMPLPIGAAAWAGRVPGARAGGTPRRDRRGFAKI